MWYEFAIFGLLPVLFVVVLTQGKWAPDSSATGRLWHRARVAAIIACTAIASFHGYVTDSAKSERIQKTLESTLAIRDANVQLSSDLKNALKAVNDQLRLSSQTAASVANTSAELEVAHRQLLINTLAGAWDNKRIGESSATVRDLDLDLEQKQERAAQLFTEALSAKTVSDRQRIEGLLWAQLHVLSSDVSKVAALEEKNPVSISGFIKESKYLNDLRKSFELPSRDTY